MVKIVKISRISSGASANLFFSLPQNAEMSGSSPIGKEFPAKEYALRASEVKERFFLIVCSFSSGRSAKQRDFPAMLAAKSLIRARTLSNSIVFNAFSCITGSLWHKRGKPASFLSKSAQMVRPQAGPRDYQEG